MPLSLSLYLYKLLQEKARVKFDKDHRIIEARDIEKIFSGQPGAAGIAKLKSAIVDGKPVNGFIYSLTPPLPPVFYHDNFKRAVIAHELGKCFSLLAEEQSESAADILDKLSDEDSAGYVRIFAWDALGKMIYRAPRLLDARKEKAVRAMGGTTAGLLAALVLFDHLDNNGGKDLKEQVNICLRKGYPLIRYRVQKALFSHYLALTGRDDFPRSSDKAANRNKGVNSCIGSDLNFEEGARCIGFISQSQKGGIISGTQQADVARRLRGVCGGYISFLGHFMKNYW